MKRSLSFILLMAVCFASQAQQYDLPEYHTNPIIKSHQLSLKVQPLYIINVDQKTLMIPDSSAVDSVVDPYVFNILKEEWIESINVFKDSKSTVTYGERGKHGVVVISLKENTYALMPKELQQRFKDVN